MQEDLSIVDLGRGGGTGRIDEGLKMEIERSDDISMFIEISLLSCQSVFIIIEINQGLMCNLELSIRLLELQRELLGLVTSRRLIRGTL